jgi:hypothetical protein
VIHERQRGRRQRPALQATLSPFTHAIVPITPIDSTTNATMLSTRVNPLGTHQRRSSRHKIRLTLCHDKVTRPVMLTVI